MGGFEIILIAIGIGWTVISAVVKGVDESKKKKSGVSATKKGAKPALSSEPEVISDLDSGFAVKKGEAQVILGEPKAPRGFSTRLKRLDELRKNRIEQLRQRIGMNLSPPAAPASKPVSPPVPRGADEVHSQAVPDEVHDSGPVTSSPSGHQGDAEARRRILDLARSDHGLKDAIILSELLAPPLALRGGHLS